MIQVESATKAQETPYTMSPQGKHRENVTENFRAYQTTFIRVTNTRLRVEISKDYPNNIELDLFLHSIAARFDDELYQFSSV